jgi:hypothetical protein
MRWRREGTALLDVKNAEWSRPVLDIIDAGLIDKLPPLISAMVQRAVCKRGQPKNSAESRRGGERRRRQHDGRHWHGNTGLESLPPASGRAARFACSDKPVIDPKVK